MQRIAALSFFLLLCSLQTGCSESLPATVTGTITIDGQAIPEDANVTGNLVFYPTGGGAAAFGDITKGGKYKITTGSTKGLAPGEYKVTVRIVEMDPEPPGGYKTAPGQKLLSPARYNDNEKTDLMANVEAGSQSIDFDLTTGK
jgi:hypothetical protein